MGQHHNRVANINQQYTKNMPTLLLFGKCSFLAQSKNSKTFIDIQKTMPLKKKLTLFVISSGFLFVFSSRPKSYFAWIQTSRAQDTFHR